MIDGLNVSRVVQHPCHNNALRMRKVKQDVRRRSWPTSEARREFAPVSPHERLIQQEAGLRIYLIEHAISRSNAVFGHIQPSLQQVTFGARRVKQFRDQSDWGVARMALPRSLMLDMLTSRTRPALTSATPLAMSALSAARLAA